MNATGWVDSLDPRERRLLAVLGSVFVVLVFALVPVLVGTHLSGRREENAAFASAIEAVQAGRAAIRKREAERQEVLARYGTPAPALASFLAERAKEAKVEIPESQDRPAVPHGKRWEERSTKVVLRKVKLLGLVDFLEGIVQAPYPLRITRLAVKRRSGEPDSWDAEVVVSAWDRKADDKSKTKPAAGGDSAPEEVP